MKCVENPRAVSHGAAQSAPPRRRTNPGKIARRAGTTILALLFCVVWFFPVYWMIITAVKPRDEIMTTTPVFWPMHLSIVLSIIVAFFACTALTLYRFRGRKPIMVFVLAIQMTSGGIIPQIIIYNQLGLLNKYSGLILAYIAMVLPFAIWNMRGFFLNIPKDIFESAAVEGANDWQILWKITFPLAAPGIVSTSVFAFINAWNDYMIAYTFMKDQSKYTLPVWLSSFSTPTIGHRFRRADGRFGDLLVAGGGVLHAHPAQHHEGCDDRCREIAYAAVPHQTIRPLMAA